MGQWWSGESEAELERAELALYSHAGIDQNDLAIRRVPIFKHLKNEENYIYEVRIKPAVAGLPKLVMIHGFQGGAAVFYKMMGHLRQHFEVIAFDLLG